MLLDWKRGQRWPHDHIEDHSMLSTSTEPTRGRQDHKVIGSEFRTLVIAALGVGLDLLRDRRTAPR
jgi:hypothetical protein